MDNAPLGKSFGTVLTGPSTSYSKGSTVSVSFQGATPRVLIRFIVLGV